MDFLFLSQTALFRGCSPRETADMLQCLRAERRVYEKDRVICHAGDTVEALGLVLSGGVNIESVDVWGSRSILGHVGPGQVFAETYACLPGEPLMVDAVAAQRTEVLFLNTARLLRTCPSACAHHAALIRNLLAVTSQKNLALSADFHTSPKTIRGRCCPTFPPRRCGKQPKLRHSLRPPAAGGLPWRGPQRAFRRAGPDARGGLIRFRKTNLSCCAALSTACSGRKESTIIEAKKGVAP
ncbi:MAG: Crp/Fnr family transcriptional regulator [Ruthenibacterium lactatiformans]